MNNTKPKDVDFTMEAKELIAKFYLEIGFMPQAKRCALAHIKLMKETLHQYAELQMLTNWYEAIKYWDRMEEAIEGL